MFDYDLAIVGAGPAGQAAAEIVAAAGLSVCLIDEQARQGGQILRQPPRSFSVANWLPGSIYTALKSQLKRSEANTDVTWFASTSVLGVEPDVEGFQLTLSSDRFRSIKAKRVLIAGGCYDMPVALPGWTLPGVMTAGAVQAFAKSQQVLAGRSLVFAGSHPLQLLVADQVVKAGGHVAAVLFPQPFSKLIPILVSDPASLIRHAPKLFGAAFSYQRLRAAGVPIHFNAQVTRVLGQEVAEAIEFRSGDALTQVNCDSVGLCFGFLPQSDLLRAAGASVRWSLPAGGWEAVHDGHMRTSVPGLYAAGESTGVAGADVALLEGQLAGLSIVTDAGRMTADQAHVQIRKAEGSLKRLDGFVRLLREVADPRSYLPDVPPETLLCRCEDIRCEQIDQALALPSAPASANAIKLITRCGMGLCQGRTCEHLVMNRISNSMQCPISEIKGFTARFPVRPTPIADILAQ
jgi:thioredoxin reductase